MSSTRRPCSYIVPLGLLALWVGWGTTGCETRCQNVDGTSSLSGTNHHCAFCGAPCALPGIRDEDHRCEGLEGCFVEDGRGCAPGYYDIDPDRAGCECVGPTRESCTRCGDHDLPFTGIDEDCDLRIDEAVDNDARDPRPPNGAAGAEPPTERVLLPDDPFVVSRAQCGNLGRTCVLPPGAVDVRCARTGVGPACEPVFPSPPVAETHRPLIGGEADCADGFDDDGNGVVDDGPTCQTLVASVSTPACHGLTPSAECPPSYVPLDPSHVRLPGSDKPLVAQMTYDVLIDNDEATVGQVQRFLVETGRCDNRAGANHPLCHDTGDPALPAGGLDWCAAYDYCQWAGKRMMTELEWLRAFGGTSGEVTVGETCAESGRTAECGADGPRPVGQSGGHAVKGLYDDATLTDVIGNQAEWVFDARIDPCEAPWADCSGPTPHARWLPLNPVSSAPADDLRRPRLLRGGGWGSEHGAASVERRQFADPGTEVAHYGVRCAQTFHPLPHGAPSPLVHEIPYDSDAESDRHALCRRQPKADRLAPRTPPHKLFRATAACAFGTESPELEAFAQRALSGETPLLLSVTDELRGAATMVIETGLVPGAEAFWLDDRPPTLTAVERGCTSSGCAFERPITAPGVISAPVRGGRLLRLPLHSARPVSGAMPTCLLRAPFGTAHWRLELTLPESALFEVFDDLDGRSAACAALRCADERVSPESCVRKCRAWRLVVDVDIELLTVP